MSLVISKVRVLCRRSPVGYLEEFVGALGVSEKEKAILAETENFLLNHENQQHVRGKEERPKKKGALFERPPPSTRSDVSREYAADSRVPCISTMITNDPAVVGRRLCQKNMNELNLVNTSEKRKDAKSATALLQQLKSRMIVLHLIEEYCVVNNMLVLNIHFRCDQHQYSSHRDWSSYHCAFCCPGRSRYLLVLHATTRETVSSSWIPLP